MRPATPIAIAPGRAGASGSSPFCGLAHREAA